MTRVLSQKSTQRKWHFHGRWEEVLLTSALWMAMSRSKVIELLGLKGTMQGDMMRLDGENYILESDLHALQPFVEQSVEGKSDFLDHLFAECDVQTAKALALRGKKDWKALFAESEELYTYSQLVHYVDYCFEPLVEQKAAQYNFPLYELTALMHPTKKTLMMQYNDRVRSIKDDEIDQLVEEFAWIPTKGFLGDPLTGEDVIAARARLRDHGETYHTTAKIPKQLEKLVQYGRELSFQRSNIVDVANKVTFGYWLVFKELAKKHGIPYDQLLQLVPDEVIALDEKGTLPSNLKDREHHRGMEMHNGVSRTFGQTGIEQMRAALPHEKDYSGITEVTGMVAYRGTVKGRVRILDVPKDGAKVEEGDVIVAAETTPDFIMAMGKAAAFVTNRGGITSHAAIIAREMHKPCVIGTKIATKVFKDGDTVEVNANQGIVRKI